jgi:hypothetical protein
VKLKLKDPGNGNGERFTFAPRAPHAPARPVAAHPVTHARRLHGIVTSDLTDRTTPRAPRAMCA